jgi:LmbE family N-acetylglucosaminyl deacetylase
MANHATDRSAEQGSRDALRLMAVLAHPDDESLGFGGTLLRYVAEGVETAVVTATLGQAGWQGDPAAFPGPEALGRIREDELRAAIAKLGVGELHLLGYMDGQLDQVDPAAAIERIVRHLRAFRPQVVITFGPEGAYGHPDHIAICQYTTAAVVASADPDRFADHAATDLKPHTVAKLYYLAPTRRLMRAYQAAFGAIAMEVDGQIRTFDGWDDWGVSCWIDVRAYTEPHWQAIFCHRSQLPTYERLNALGAEERGHIFGDETYYRALSLVNGGRAREDDLFAGLR